MQQFEILSGVLGAVKSRVVVFLMVLIVGIIGTIIYTVSQPQTYSATAVIQIESAQVSEPTHWALFVTGLLGVFSMRRKKASA